MTKKIPREELISEIQRLERELGRTPKLTDLSDMGKHSKMPYEREFGGWTNAVVEAGLVPNSAFKISKVEIVGELQKLADELSRPPRYKDLGEYLPFSYKVVKDRFGSWNAALEAAGFDVWEGTNEQNPFWKGGPLKKVCEYCGDEYEALRCHSDRSRFCSRGCKDEWQSVHLAGENNPFWSGGVAPYGSGWNDAKKEAVRERDGRECVECGRSEAVHLEKFGRKHSVHHIQKARSFDDPEERNAMDNLVTLCMGACHHKWEQMSPLRPQTAD